MGTPRDIKLTVAILSSFFVASQSQVVAQNVRLKDGDASYQGRLEIKYKGEWGTVCNRSFNRRAATIVCNQFGLAFQNFYNPKSGPTGGRIWLENVQCNGNEQSIFDCTHNGWGNVTDCLHNDDIGITCGITDGAIILTAKPSNELGVGSVKFYQGEFRTLLNFSGWDDIDALVVCKQLGYSTTGHSVCLSSTCGPIDCPGGNFSARLWRNNRINCTGQERRLIKCPSGKWIADSNCDNTYNAASVKCAVPIQGGWTSWVNKSPCSSLCVNGTQTRVRNCTRPIPEYGGEDCIGKSTDTIQCGENSCVAPDIICPPVTQTVKSSSNVSFVCVASSKPRATIQWTRNGNVLTNSSKIVITNDTEGNCPITDPPDQYVISSKLEIFNTEPPDRGTITCNATNEAGYLERSATLSVDGTPVIEVSPQFQNIIKFNNVSFNCNVIGYPHPEVEWLKNDTVLANVSSGAIHKLLIISSELGDCVITKCGLNSTLSIFNTTENDTGTYACSASNIAGNITRTVHLNLIIENDSHTNIPQIILPATFGFLLTLKIISCGIYGYYRFKDKLQSCLYDKCDQPPYDNTDGDIGHRSIEMSSKKSKSYGTMNSKEAKM